MRWPAGLLAVLSVVLAGAVSIAQAPAVAWQPQASGVTGRLRGVSAVSSRVAVFMAHSSQADPSECTTPAR